MKPQDIFNAIGNIDDKYISEFADTAQFKKKKIFFLSPKFYGSIAAVFIVGVAVFIALQMNNSSVDIQNNQTNHLADVSQNTLQESSTFPTNDNNKSEYTPNAPTNPRNPPTDINKSADTDDAENAGKYITPEPAPTDHYAYAEEPYYENSTSSESIQNMFLGIKVYASEIAEPLSEKKTVTIKGDFNPLMSSSEGIGIEFGITTYSPVTVTAESGYFVTWDKKSGEITEHGSSFIISEETDFFWTFDTEFKNTFIHVSDGNSVIASINISYDENTNTFSATLDK